MLEYLQVLGDGLKAHCEGLSEFAHRGFSSRQPTYDRPSSPIRKCGEHGIQPGFVDHGAPLFNHHVE